MRYINPDQQSRSHLFTVRLRPEYLGDGRIEWRGQIRLANSDQIRYFRTWPDLVSHLQAMLADAEVDPIASPTSEDAAS